LQAFINNRLTFIYNPANTKEKEKEARIWVEFCGEKKTTLTTTGFEASQSSSSICMSFPRI